MSKKASDESGFLEMQLRLIGVDKEPAPEVIRVNPAFAAWIEFSELDISSKSDQSPFSRCKH